MTTSTSEKPRLQSGLDFGLRTPQRYITTIDKEGKSIFAPHRDLLYFDRDGYSVSWNYATSAFPAALNDNQDLNDFLTDDPSSSASYVHTGTRIVHPTGLTMNTTNFAPGAATGMHRTVSLDLVAVIEGEIEMELDSGEKVLLRAGDSIVQRETMHLWRNPSKDKTARLVSVITPAEAVTVNGRTFGLEGFKVRTDDSH